MSWLVAHKESERLADLAHDAKRQDQFEKSKDFFVLAARAEELAFSSLGESQPRTLGIVAVSATALYFKGGELNLAENFAHRAMSVSYLPAFAYAELRELLQSIWNELAQTEAGVKFVPGQVVVSVKGGEVITGGAPLELILNRVQIIQNIFFRTAEFVIKYPFREKGLPSKNIQQKYRPWLFQTVPGSYQFIVAIQKPPQADLFGTDDPEPELLTEKFLDILRASTEEEPSAMQTLVPDEKYRKVFLKLTRNLAPTGKSFESMQIRSTKETKGVILSSDSRRQINDHLRVPITSLASNFEEESVVKGLLRALDLERDWLEVTDASGNHIRINHVGEAVDDLIGPMVNQSVVVRTKKDKNNKLTFIDIETEH